MIILHGALLDDALFLWGESPAEGAREQGPAQAGPSHPYPYDAGAEAVTRAARELPIAFRPTARRKAEATAWLPTRGDHPLPSSALIGEAPESTEPVESAPWLVEGISLSAAEALDLLSGYGQRAGMLHGVRGRARPALLDPRGAARRARWWRASATCPAPSSTREGKLHARWQPVWITEDLRYLEELARAMPAAARALVHQRRRRAADARPSRSSSASSSSSSITSCARTASPRPRTASSRSRATLFAGEDSPDSTVHDRWLAALRAEQAALRGKDDELERSRPSRSASGASRSTSRSARRSGSASGSRSPRRRAKSRSAASARSASATARRACARRCARASAAGTCAICSRAPTIPSLLVPTADAWILRGRKAAALQRSGSDVHQTLLLSLAQAAGVCPKIEMSLRSRKPSGYSLDARGAHEFLTQTAPALEQAGFGTILPEWWTGGSTRHRLSVRARVRTPEQSELDYEPRLDETVSFDWEVVSRRAAALGPRPRRPRAPEGAAPARARALGADERRGDPRRARVLQEPPRRRGDRARDRAHGARRRRHVGGHPLRGRARHGLARRAARAALGQERDRAARDTARASRARCGPYQEKGFAWLEFLRRWELGACLADDMGLGKTIQTLALIERERDRRRGPPGAARVPDVGARELGARGRALHAEPAHGDPPRPAAQEGLRVRRGRAGPRARAHELCARAPRPRRPALDALGGRDPRRGAEHQEPRHQAVAWRCAR